MLRLAACVSLAGCTSPRQYWANHCKVGPEYCTPCVEVAPDWIDADDKRVLHDPAELAAWWTTFNDPVLNNLIAEAYSQNLTLREAGARVLEARRLRAIAVGQYFPQQQSLSGSYSYNKSTGTGPGSRFSNWSDSFSLAWELDFWGRYRRAITAADADLDASIYDYGDVAVTLIADVAATYVDIRTTQARLELVRRNVDNQQRTYDIVEARFEEQDVSQIDVQQAKSSVAQTQSFVPQLESALRLSQNQLCVLLGVPPEDLTELLGKGEIPDVPQQIAVGIPAQTLLRRPDVRRAERQLAAQSELIGIAESDLYPHITLSGNAGVSSRRIDQLFTEGAFFASIGPSFRWDLLNYGRIVNNVGVQEARFLQLLAAYRQSVLLANLEAENAINLFLRSQERLDFQLQAAKAADETNQLILFSLEEGQVDYNRVFNVQNFKTQQEESAAVAKGQVAQNLIEIYRSLGGGWPMRPSSAVTTTGSLDADDTGEQDSDAEPLPVPDNNPLDADASELELPDSVDIRLLPRDADAPLVYPSEL
ncbi:Toluene efflux pump outer membrane protein TtgF precursor [Posidoniimonas polymericola]|uniref:Toluene efflux pump outer membrane protein TtgF n=1 Tax=Posidoniimonas polymericola TaxID=2528002 RepID=A0A5C5YTM7_9BACT|nr:efflux transporter outer membrane subunit [Posidoniimonas polymericola]TWT78318.1 Toluene efflux pump outer membrane protein TtgF precursor [Posidoniimonas polymericola]